MAGEKKVERFGAAIDDLVINQIVQRQNALGSNNKTREQIEFINSNAAWVKLRSSVDKVNSAEAAVRIKNNKPLDGLKTNNLIALNYQLTGGTLNPESRTPRSGILRTPNSDNPNAGGRPAALNRDTEAYLNYSSTGIRPMPGVTGMSVRHKNTYGTLMEATVNFNVWSKEQLEDVELLYFRPGYTALLEWGHSVFLDNSGNLKVASDSMCISDGLFFNDKNKSEKIEDEILLRRRIYSGNYQGMFGFITNFDWSFRPDGGYDCSVHIVSKGSVIESLKTPNISAHIPCTELPTEEELKRKGREKDAEAFRSIFSYLDSILQDYEGNDYSFSLRDFLNEKNGKTLANKIKQGYKESSFILNYSEFPEPDYKVFHTKIKKTDNEPSYLTYFLTRVSSLFWIDMKTFLAIVNQIYLLKNPNVNGNSITFFSLAFGERYKTFSGHFSLDPIVALIPRVPNDNRDFVIRKEGLKSINSEMSGYLGQRMINAPSLEERASDIMNIMISTNFLATEANRVIQADEDGIGVLDFVTSVLNGINRAFGGINNLSVFYDHDNCVFKIVDRGQPITTSKFPTINVTGLNNTVVDLKVQSKISSNISSQISIAAQGHSGTYGENLKSMLQWNLGALDRHIEKKDQTSDGVNQQDSCKVNSNVEGQPINTANKAPTVEEIFAKAFKQFVDENVSKGNVNLELWSQISNEGSNYINQQYLDSLVKSKTIESMPVPVTLQLKLLGISGVKIASTFKINKQVLPSKYHKYAFIVTGVDHEIGTDNRWYTTITAQFYATGL